MWVLKGHYGGMNCVLGDGRGLGSFSPELVMVGGGYHGVPSSEEEERFERTTFMCHVPRTCTISFSFF